ncbi:MAG: helix-turn-helix domain-containing protein [Erythrobacter sp.]
MSIKAHLKSVNDQRSDGRRELRLETSARSAGAAGSHPDGNVVVHNISAAGLLIETTLSLDVADQLMIDMPEAGEVAAVIVWRSNNLYGCAFAEALDQAVLAAAQLQAKPAAYASPAPLGGGAALGVQLNRLRRERGMTLADVADALGVSKPTVWAWEKGKARPLPERLDAIAEALGVETQELQSASAADPAAEMLIRDARMRIAAAYNADPSAVRIMIEL